MPIYEYQCGECGVHFERRQRWDDPQPGTCPNGHSQVRRILSQPAIIFRGSGFYATDHGRNGSGASRKAKADTQETEKSAKREAKPPEVAADAKPEKSTDS
jgi:putative FmdB family regulatory protein